MSVGYTSGAWASRQLFNITRCRKLAAAQLSYWILLAHEQTRRISDLKARPRDRPAEIRYLRLVRERQTARLRKYCPIES